MIDESFIQAAIKIRRTYLKLTNNMDFYKTKAEKLSTNLNGIVSKLEKLQSDLSDKGGKDISAEGAIVEVTKILREIEDEGKGLESVINPLNEEIEKLALEEQELWRMIKEKHYDVPDNNIIEYVKKRLIDANLSK
jgi:chromosome segregation ATPase